jgi:anaerobic selenocysteine-containing dehydrogenase
MGITQHANGTGNVHQPICCCCAEYGQAGGGICPLRGHSNVQGDRTVGITEIPDEGMPLVPSIARFGLPAPRPAMRR